MGKLFEPLGIGGNLYMGHPLRDALESIAAKGLRYVDIACIEGNCMQIRPDEMSDERAAEVRALLDELGLDTYAFSGHVDMTDDEHFKRFLTKMKFARALGARVINTRCGPPTRLREFRRNLAEAVRLAEKLELTIGLESHGDIVGTARQAAGLLAEINHPLVRLNYDTGNTYYHAGGNVDIGEDIKYGLEWLGYVHLKDIHLEGNYAWYRALGDGDLDFVPFLDALRSLGRPVPCGIEVPIFMEGALGGGLTTERAPLTMEVIERTVDTSLRTLQRLDP